MTVVEVCEDQLHLNIAAPPKLTYNYVKTTVSLQEATVADDIIPDHKKADICRRIAEVDRSLIDGSNEELQLLDLASVAMQSCSSRQ